MRVVVTRPEEDAGPLKAKLEALGHEVILVPLLVIAPRAGVWIEALPWQAAVATSANAIRSLTGHDELKSLRILTVGPQSLQAAREAGCDFVLPNSTFVDLLPTDLEAWMKSPASS